MSTVPVFITLTSANLNDLRHPHIVIQVSHIVCYHRLGPDMCTTVVVNDGLSFSVTESIYDITALINHASTPED